MAQIQYFLGANTSHGFYSLYDHLIDLETAQAVYILKGGPGCGKSSFMRRIARHAQAAGYSTQFILCSGDPSSLDGLVIPELKVALVDGTAPHVIEPQYPGVVERYINLGQFYDSRGLQQVRAAVAEDMAGYRQHYKRCYRCLSAAFELDAEVRELLLTPEVEARLAKRARGIIARELKGAGPGGENTRRFLGAVTHSGQLCCWETVDAQCKRVYSLLDSYGLAHTMLQAILNAAAARDYASVVCPDPMDPSRLAHLLIPELGLAFVTSAPGLEYPGRPHRRIRLDAMLTDESFRLARSRIRFTRKVSAALKQEAVDALAQAKARHDVLEQHYNPYVDFDGVYALADRLADEILATASPELPPED